MQLSERLKDTSLRGLIVAGVRRVPFPKVSGALVGNNETMGAETESSQEKPEQERPKPTLSQEQFLSWKRHKVSFIIFYFPNSIFRVFLSLSLCSVSNSVFCFCFF